MAGLTEEGFARATFEEIRREYEQTLRDAFGPVNLGPDSVLGQFVASAAEREASVWELAEAIYYAMYPSTASGRALDGVCEFNGIKRRPATSTFGVGVLIGENATDVPAGSRASNPSTEDVYETVSDRTISTSQAVRVVLSVSGDDGTYSVTIGDTEYDYEAEDESADSIAEELADLVDANNDVDAEADGDEITITAEDRESDFEISIDGPLDYELIGSPVEFRAVEAGEKFCPAGSLSE
ncbi:MAG: baseplate J/gp47 family protein, partial [Spirochaetota bacterium]